MSLTGFDDDKGCCGGKQHGSFKILRENWALKRIKVLLANSSTSLSLFAPTSNICLSAFIYTHTQMMMLAHRPGIPRFSLPAGAPPAHHQRSRSHGNAPTRTSSHVQLGRLILQTKNKKDVKMKLIGCSMHFSVRFYGSVSDAVGFFFGGRDVPRGSLMRHTESGCHAAAG